VTGRWPAVPGRMAAVGRGDGREPHERVSGDYTLVDRCDNCGGRALSAYGASPAPGAAHPFQCRCRDYGLVLASPRLTPQGLERLYERYFTELAPAGLDDPAEEQRRRLFRRLLEEIRTASAGRRLLDVGAGTGALVAEARAAGFDAEGIELSRDGAESALRRYGIELRRATLEEAGFPPEHFDVVVAWHVIEHVFDLDGFVRALHRVLRPGGLVVVGTESYAYPANTILRASAFARGRCPPAVTSAQHTFVFSVPVLRDCFERRGFRARYVVAYDELGLSGRLGAVGARSSWRRALAQAVVLLSEAGARASRRGPYLRAAFERVS
jgi:SAM-dependent methyltransferase